MAVVQFSLLASLLLSMCLLSLVAQATDVHYCDKKASYEVKVSEIDITPYPVIRGKPATFSINASAGICYLRDEKARLLENTGSIDKAEEESSLSYGKEGRRYIRSEAISGGKLVIDVSYFWFHVYSESHDLCEKTSCPVSAGDFIISHSQELPGFTPPGSYTLTMKLEDENNHQLTCITFDFSIGFVASEVVADI